MFLTKAYNIISFLLGIGATPEGFMIMEILGTTPGEITCSWSAH